MGSAVVITASQAVGSLKSVTAAQASASPGTDVSLTTHVASTVPSSFSEELLLISIESIFPLKSSNFPNISLISTPPTEPNSSPETEPSN